MHNKHPNTSQEQLRDVGVELPGVVSRQGSTDLAVAQFGRTGMEIAGSYVTSLDRLRLQRLVTREALRAGHRQVGELLGRARMWRKALGRSSPFAPSDLERIADKPNAVLSYAEYLLKLARDRAERLPYAEAMIADVESQLEAARNAWHTAHLERVELKDLQQDVRDKGHALRNAALTLLVVLEPKLGADHPDCALLKVTRKAASADDDDADDAESSSHGNGAEVTTPAASATL